MEQSPPPEVFAALEPLLDIYSVISRPPRHEFHGRLSCPPSVAFARARAALAPFGYVPIMRRCLDGLVSITAVPAPPLPPPRRWLAGWLALLTFCVMTAVGAVQHPDRSLLMGLYHSAPLMLILLAHEAGHYVAARRYGVPLSLPLFIPLPLPPLGTLGAVMLMRQPPPDRRAMLRIAAAGPLAGLLVALPVTFIGLLLSEAQPVPAHAPVIREGSSLLYHGLKLLIFGETLPSAGRDVMLHPMAFAGWAGLLLTAFNLVPAAQLDGGHALAAIFPPDLVRIINQALITAFVVIGATLWSGWIVWGVITAIMLNRSVRPLDDVTPLRPLDYGIAFAMLLLCILLFTPIPLQVVLP